MSSDIIKQGGISFVRPARAPRMDATTVINLKPDKGKFVIRAPGGKIHLVPSQAAEMQTGKRELGRHYITTLRVTDECTVTCEGEASVTLSPGFYYVNGAEGGAR